MRNRTVVTGARARWSGRILATFLPVLVVAMTSVGFATTAGPAGASPIFGTMNDTGGIYWRSAPDWNTPVAVSGFGFYPGTAVSVQCYRSGSTVPGSGNTMWVYASWASGPGRGSGWMNEHFVDDGMPINQAAPGVPACDAPTPTPPPPPPPPPPPAGRPTFPTMNDGGGVYWRSAPDWNTPVAVPGNGFYLSTHVTVECYQSGTTVPNSANSMWVRASWASGAGHGSGWMNEHFLNDGAAINQPAPGVPPCNGGPAPAPAPESSAGDRAIKWAVEKLGRTTWDGQCLAFVYQAYLQGAGVDITAGLPQSQARGTAYTYWTAAPNHHTDRNPPAGALVFWRGARSPTGAGHVGMSLGGGTIISTYDGRTSGVHEFNINSYQQDLYLGWVQNW